MLPFNYQNITTQLETHFPTFSAVFRTLNTSVKTPTLDFTNVSTKLRTLIVAILLTTFGASHAAAYEMFGKEAYNVGGHVDRPLYGQPGAAVFQENHDNPHLLHSVHQGHHGLMYVNKATGKCLLAHNGNNGALTGYWDCEPGDAKMNWKLHSVGGGAYLFENMRYRGQCLDNPIRNNGGLLHMYRCDGNNYNQKFWRVTTHGGWQDPAPWGSSQVPAFSGQLTIAGTKQPHLSQNHIEGLTLIRTGVKIADYTAIDQFDYFGYNDDEIPFLTIDGWMLKSFESRFENQGLLSPLKKVNVSKAEVQAAVNQYCQDIYRDWTRHGDNIIPNNAWHVWGHVRNGHCIYNGEKPKRYHINFRGPVSLFTAVPNYALRFFW